ncbi:MAG: PLDc N-terminal domain-containing protein [Gammaproteobacteria bacterium]|nr:PLDc N-terminal domain-containing protein [Gammaproteobacteria bacterium]
MNGTTDFALPGAAQMALNFYAWALPLLLAAVWATLAIWDLGRRTDLAMPARVAWSALVLLVPLLGPLLYHLAARPQLDAGVRWIAVGGGGALYALVLCAGALAGGIT